MTSTTPYGAWRSPLTAHDLTAGSVGLEPGTIEHGHTYWTESHSDQGGRTSLWCQDADGIRRELTPEHYIRSMVHEYGGGAWAVRDGIVVYSTFPTHQCFVLRDGVATALTPDTGKLRYADFEIHPDRDLVLAVREDHRDSDLNCVNEIVALPLSEPGTHEGTVLCSGADFYAAPRLSNDDRLAWVEWDHPNMPWDHTRLMVATLGTGMRTVTNPRRVAGDGSAPCHPQWRGADLIYLDDPSGYWNFYSCGDDGDLHRLNEDEHDYCYPPWVFGAEYTLLDDGRIACLRCEGGREQAGILSADGTFTPLRRRTSSVTIGGASGDRLLLLASFPDEPAQLELVDLVTTTTTELRRAFELSLPPESISIAQSRTWNGAQGPVQAWFYPPRNADFVAPEGELPPLRVLVHGGPTGMTVDALRLGVQYWTTRGFAVLDVNYGGSAGFGRAYRERLQGNWGVLDVADCAAGVAELVAAGLVDGRRVAIEGGSAGGYTTLAALTSSDAFTAGNSLYGIAELTAFAHDTHKFESRYLNGLFGGSPDERPDVYEERSPINHLDRLRVPMLIQQGADDRIVPANQAHLMADAVRAKGLPVALLVFEGEGHGWRRAETIRTSVEASLSFYGQVFGFEPVDVPRLRIDNIASPTS